MKNRTSTAIVAGSLVSTFLLTTAGAASSANAAGITPAAATAATSRSGGLTSSDWQNIAARARVTGDTESARAAEDLATRTSGPQAKTQNIVVDIAKRAIVAALRHGAGKLPGPVGKYAAKAAGVIEDIESLEKAPLIYALMRSGIPAHDADYIAQWCVTFAGI